MPKRLYAFTDRAESHAKLDEVRAGKHPMAECREDPNSEAPYEVWDGPEQWVMPEPAVPPDPAVLLAEQESLLDALAERLLAKMAERGA